MSVQPHHDELHDFWFDDHESANRNHWHEPVNRNRLDVLLIVVAFFVMLAFVLWMVWGVLDDTVQRAGDLPQICVGMTNTWDCVALIHE